MKNLLLIILIFLIAFYLGFCKENEIDLPDGEGVNFYLLEKYETNQGCEIDENLIELSEDPIIPYVDIIAYNSIEYKFQFSEKAQKIVGQMDHSVLGVPFAIAEGKELIYTGYFWPAYSSASCDWITIDPMSIEYSGEAIMSLGYPGLLPGHSIPDKRNDARILEIFRRDGKLIE